MTSLHLRYALNAPDCLAALGAAVIAWFTLNLRCWSEQGDSNGLTNNNPQLIFSTREKRSAAVPLTQTTSDVQQQSKAFKCAPRRGELRKMVSEKLNITFLNSGGVNNHVLNKLKSYSCICGGRFAADSDIFNYSI